MMTLDSSTGRTPSACCDSMLAVSDESRATPDGGLSSEEAAVRLERDGRNELPAVHKQSLARQFAGELVHFFALMLWVAGLLALVAGMAQLAVAIFAVVIVNATFSFIQQRRSDHAAERLNALLPRRVTVRRDGQSIEIDAALVVVGDLMLLAAGDRVPADASIVLNRGLRLDTSMLTGESNPVDVEVSDRISGGTFVLDGEADAEVVATGRNTRLAQISTLTTSTNRPPPPLTTELKRVVRTIGMISVGTGLTFLVGSLLLGTTMSKSVVLAIGVTVALIPEGLLPTVTLSLAIGAQRMAHHNTLVRHLDAVETLGSTTFICTDKTGTLTDNHMVVAALWTPAATHDRGRHRVWASRKPDPRDRFGSGHDRRLVLLPRDAARVVPANKTVRGSRWVTRWRQPSTPAPVGSASTSTPTSRTRVEIVRFPFDATRKRTSSVVQAESERVVADVLVKGAVEGMLLLCRDERHSGSVPRRSGSHDPEGNASHWRRPARDPDRHISAERCE